MEFQTTSSSSFEFEFEFELARSARKMFSTFPSSDLIRSLDGNVYYGFLQGYYQNLSVSDRPIRYDLIV